jgi:hypothetical protein
MGARLNRIDPREFIATPAARIGRPRKVPREVRKQLYQLDMTIRETKHEIRRLLSEHGISDLHWHGALAKIRRERGA